MCLLPAGCGGLFEAFRAVTGKLYGWEGPSGFGEMVHWKDLHSEGVLVSCISRLAAGEVCMLLDSILLL